jgi:hypothetical protein
MPDNGQTQQQSKIIRLKDFETGQDLDVLAYPEFYTDFSGISPELQRNVGLPDWSDVKKIEITLHDGTVHYIVAQKDPLPAFATDKFIEVEEGGLRVKYYFLNAPFQTRLGQPTFTATQGLNKTVRYNLLAIPGNAQGIRYKRVTDVSWTTFVGSSTTIDFPALSNETVTLQYQAIPSDDRYYANSVIYTIDCTAEYENHPVASSGVNTRGWEIQAFANSALSGEPSQTGAWTYARPSLGAQNATVTLPAVNGHPDGDFQAVVVNQIGVGDPLALEENPGTGFKADNYYTVSTLQSPWAIQTELTVYIDAVAQPVQTSSTKVSKPSGGNVPPLSASFALTGNNLTDFVGSSVSVVGPDSVGIEVGSKRSDSRKLLRICINLGRTSNCRSCCSSRYCRI